MNQQFLELLARAPDLRQIQLRLDASAVWTAVAVSIGLVALYYVLNAEWDRVPRLDVPLEEGTPQAQWTFGGCIISRDAVICATGLFTTCLACSGIAGHDHQWSLQAESQGVYSGDPLLRPRDHAELGYLAGHDRRRCEHLPPLPTATQERTCS